MKRLPLRGAEAVAKKRAAPKQGVRGALIEACVPLARCRF